MTKMWELKTYTVKHKPTGKYLGGNSQIVDIDNRDIMRYSSYDRLKSELEGICWCPNRYDINDVEIVKIRYTIEEEAIENVEDKND